MLLLPNNFNNQRILFKWVHLGEHFALWVVVLVTHILKKFGRHQVDGGHGPKIGQPTQPLPELVLPW